VSDPSELNSYLDAVVERALDDSPDPATDGTAAPPPPATVKARVRRALRRVYEPVAREEIVRQDRTEARLATDSARTLAAIAGLEVEIEQLRAELARRPAVAAVETAAAKAGFDELYLAFENRFRGTTAEITERLVPYLNDLYPLADKGAPVLDLGSGRGEWLALLAEHGIEAEGVDLNAEFCERCRTAGLAVRVGDAFAALESAPTDSLGAITAFQLVEHVGIPKTALLFHEAARALRPGGLVIAETPNPTNLRVGAASFYRDPTHRRPVHPDLLQFIAEREGFTVGVRYVNPMPQMSESFDQVPAWAANLVEELRWALYGPLDYAVVAEKPPG
jgi:O-antigen chain-terminating methyltransferase